MQHTFKFAHGSLGVADTIHSVLPAIILSFTLIQEMLTEHLAYRACMVGRTTSFLGALFFQINNTRNSSPRAFSETRIMRCKASECPWDKFTPTAEIFSGSLPQAAAPYPRASL